MGLREKGFAFFRQLRNSPVQEPVVLAWCRMPLDQCGSFLRRVKVRGTCCVCPEFPRLIPEHGVKGRVGVDDVAAVVGDGDSFGHAPKYQGLGVHGLFHLFTFGDVLGQADEAP